jgi:hypothetical protein
MVSSASFSVECDRSEVRSSEFEVGVRGFGIILRTIHQFPPKPMARYSELSSIRNPQSEIPDHSPFAVPASRFGFLLTTGTLLTTAFLGGLCMRLRLVASRDLCGLEPGFKSRVEVGESRVGCLVIRRVRAVRLGNGIKGGGEVSGVFVSFVNSRADSSDEG